MGDDIRAAIERVRAHLARFPVVRDDLLAVSADEDDHCTVQDCRAVLRIAEAAMAETEAEEYHKAAFEDLVRNADPVSSHNHSRANTAMLAARICRRAACRGQATNG